MINPLRTIKKIKATYQFKKNCIYKNRLYIDYRSRCVNLSKDKIIIGKDSKILGSLFAYYNATIKIGDNFYMGPNSVIGSKDNITIGNQVIISNDVTIYDNNNHPTSPKERYNMSISGFGSEKWEWKYSDSKEVIIEDNVWIGQYSTLLKGVRVGKGSIVATRSVVTKDVPPFVVVAGNPARIVKNLKNDHME